MKAKKLIITAILSLAILGLTGCLKDSEKPSTNIPPYKAGNQDLEPIKEVRDLPEDVEKALNTLGINIGILPIVDHENGDIFIFKGRDIDIGFLEFPISTSSIESVTPISAFRYVGSKCMAFVVGDSVVGGCSHIQ